MVASSMQVTAIYKARALDHESLQRIFAANRGEVSAFNRQPVAGLDSLVARGADPLPPAGAGVALAPVSTVSTAGHMAPRVATQTAEAVAVVEMVQPKKKKHKGKRGSAGPANVRGAGRGMARGGRGTGRGTGRGRAMRTSAEFTGMSKAARGRKKRREREESENG